MYKIELLAEFHQRDLFTCGIEVLDRYLKQQAGQEIRKHVATTFVLRAAESCEVMGYYTLSSLAIDVGELPENLSKKLPKYPLLPATLLGRMAIHKDHRGKGLGELLIIDALQRSVQSSKEIASMVVIVDAKDEKVAGFYQHYGFIPFLSYKHKLFLPMSTAIKLFAE